MKIVIEIPEEIYDFVQNTSFVEDENTLFKQSNADRQKTLFLFDIIDAIRNGTPLPEHHGLIDRLELSDHIKNRLIQTAMNNMEIILPYSKVCTDIVDNRIDTWIDEVKPIIEGSESE